MASPEFRLALRLPSYSGTPAARLPPAFARLPLIALALACAVTHGGCAMSFQLDSLFAKKGGAGSEVTGSTDQSAFASAFEADKFEADLVYARTAAAELLARGGKDASIPWENPNTGARGTVTPIASTYSEDGAVCRNFLASYVRGESQAWLQGEACRMTAGRWEVKSLKPFNHT